jgi:hypothetical protein
MIAVQHGSNIEVAVQVRRVQSLSLKTCGQFVDRIRSTAGIQLLTNGKERKTLTNSWWLQLSKWQKLSFLPNL